MPRTRLSVVRKNLLSPLVLHSFLKPVVKILGIIIRKIRLMFAGTMLGWGVGSSVSRCDHSLDPRTERRAELIIVSLMPTSVREGVKLLVTDASQAFLKGVI